MNCQKLRLDIKERSNSHIKLASITTNHSYLLTNQQSLPRKNHRSPYQHLQRKTCHSLCWHCQWAHEVLIPKSKLVSSIDQEKQWERIHKCSKLTTQHSGKGSLASNASVSNWTDDAEISKRPDTQNREQCKNKTWWGY